LGFQGRRSPWGASALPGLRSAGTIAAPKCRRALRAMVAIAPMTVARAVSSALAVLSVMIGAVVAAREAHSEEQAAPPPAGVVQANWPPSRGTLVLAIVSKVSGSELSGATVWVRTIRGRLHTWEGTADNEGRYPVVRPSEATDAFEIIVASPGYVPRRLRSSAVAIEHTMKLEPAEMIGGTVRDERGLPIAGARVLATTSSFMMTWPEIYTSPHSGRAIATTDAQGHWRSGSLPADTPPNGRVRVLVTHSDHVMTESDTTAAEARAFSSVQVMKTGVSISGEVLTPYGSPVWDATVVVGLQPWTGLRTWEGMYLQLRTGKDGSFRTGRCIDPLQPKWVLIVQASGLAITAREVPATADAPPQVIRLTRRRPIEGRVVDTEGHSLAGAIVTSSMYSFEGLLGWDTQTDDSGRFVWYDAPSDDNILINIRREPLQPLSVKINPRERARTITLYDP
jgi:hypothetical protein